MVIPRVVLDTNVVLDLLHFRDPGAVALAAAWRAGRVQAVTNAACLAELQRVLAYPAFGLDARAQTALHAHYLCSVEIIEASATMDPLVPALPRCSDPDDQKFLELARRCGAAFLVSKDRALLRLARRMARIDGCTVVAPRGFVLPG